MANRGGGNPGRGRPPGGCGGSGWQDGFDGGRSGNFFEGGPSGTAGNGGEASDGTGNQANVFGDGVFKAGQGQQTYGGDQRYQQGFNNYNDRRNTGYNGNYNNYNSTTANSRYAAVVPGLSEAQQKLVWEAAEAFARQLAGRPKLLNVDSHSAARGGVEQPAAPLIRQPGFARVQPVQQNVTAQPQRAEVVLMVVAGVGSKDQVYDHEGMSGAEFVAANKRKGPSCFRCRKMGTSSMTTMRFCVIVVRNQIMLQTIVLYIRLHVLN
jgi:hypothetical protein